MNILFYSSFNSRSITLESIIVEVAKKHKVFFLTTCEKGKIHFELEKKGINCYSSQITNKRFLKHSKEIFFLIKFIKNKKIKLVYSHLQLPNLYSSISSKILKVKLYTFRHNSDLIRIRGNIKEVIIEKIINKLSPNIVAISNKVHEQLLIEKVKSKKISIINNGYNFELYHSLSDENNYLKLKKQFKDKIVVLFPGRLIETKNHIISLDTFCKLKVIYPNIHLIIIGSGPLKNIINKRVLDRDLLNHVSLFDFTEYISDYYKISDITIQPSISEASNNVIKEALYFRNKVIACNNVGDFNEYLDSNFLIEPSNLYNELLIRIDFLVKKDLTNEIEKSRSKMIKKFNIKEVLNQYKDLKF